MLLLASRGPNCVTAQGDCDRDFFLPRVSLNVGARCLRCALCCASCRTTEMCAACNRIDSRQWRKQGLFDARVSAPANREQDKWKCYPAAR